MPARTHPISPDPAYAPVIASILLHFADGDPDKAALIEQYVLGDNNHNRQHSTRLLGELAVRETSKNA